MWLSHTTSHGILAPCQISEKTNDTIPRKHLDRRMDGRVEGQKDKQTFFIGPFRLTPGVQKVMVINYLKICWQIKYFLSKFYLEILKWSFVWVGDWYGNLLVENYNSLFCNIIICWIAALKITTGQQSLTVVKASEHVTAEALLNGRHDRHYLDIVKTFFNFSSFANSSKINFVII